MNVTMRSTLLFAGLSLALAGCGRDEPKSPVSVTPPAHAAPGATQGERQENVATPNSPAGVGGSASAPEGHPGRNPVQGQVDPKQGEQHRDFESKGDGAGPKNPASPR